MKCLLRAWGQLKPPFEVLALGEMCFDPWGHLKPPFHCPHALKTHFRAGATVENPLLRCWHALKNTFDPCQQFKPLFRCPHALKNTFQGMVAVETPFSTAPEMCLDGIGGS